jgi:hypothetical protein
MAVHAHVEGDGWKGWLMSMLCVVTVGLILTFFSTWGLSSD